MSTARLPLFAGLLAGLAAGCGKPDPADRYRAPAEVRDFARLYKQNCRACHGADGKLGPAPPLNDPLFLAIFDDDALRMIIARGRKGTLMPAFGGLQTDVLKRIPNHPVIGTGLLTSDQIDVLVTGIRKHWGQPVKGKGPLPPYLEGKELTDQLAKADVQAGRKIFAAQCADCHGTDGKGGKDAGAVNQPAFLGLMSDQVLRRIIITGRPDLGMPDYRKRDDRPLTEKQINDLAALLASWRGQDATAGE